MRQYIESAQVVRVLADASLVPGLSDLPAKLLSQCGIVTAILVVAVIWLALQLAKARDGWEKDRTGMLKMIADQNESYEKIAVAHAKLEGLIYGMKSRDTGGDD